MLSTEGKLVIAAAVTVIAIGLLVWLAPFTIVNTGERAVVLNWGQVDRVLEPGIHWVTPVAESTKTLDVTTKKLEAVATAASKDLQNVATKIALNFNIDPTKAGEIWTMFRGAQDDVAVVPAIQEAVKSATSKYTAEELITKREAAKDDISRLLEERLRSVHLVATQVSITDFSFSKEFDNAIEAKVTAEQQALTEKNNLDKVKFQAQQSIEQARAQAEAIRIQAQSISAQGGEEYVKLKAIEKWDGVLPTQIVPGGAVPFISLAPTK